MGMSLPPGVGGLAGRVGRGALRAASALDRELDRPVRREVAPERHPLQPAAIRVERTRSHGAERQTQTAVTMWFGEGPALPAPGFGQSPVLRGAMRLGLGLVGAAALAALTVAAERERRLPGAAARGLITAPSQDRGGLTR